MFLAIKVLIMCFIVIGLVTQVHALVRNYKFEVINSSHTKLCTNKTMLTVNGQSPGPTIYATRGDLVIIDVINNSDKNITIHWHGVKMPRYPWSDGTEYITQCPITPGTRFRQRMILSDEEGTLLWHAHSDWSRNSVYGAIIILPPMGEMYPFPKPHAEFPILIGEWWNIDVQKVVDGFLASGEDPQIADALLINGHPGDMYPCSKQDTYRLNVEFGKTYMIRLINTVMDFIVFFNIANHSLTVVGTDAAYTKPLKSDYVAISPGQTMDLLLEANQAPGHYYMGARVLGFGGEYITTPTTGIMEYAGNYIPPSSPELPTFPAYDNYWASTNFTNKLRNLGSNAEVPTNVTKNLLYTLTINQLPCRRRSCAGTERFMASVNNVSMVLPKDGVDILEAYYRGISGVYTTDFPEYPPFQVSYSGERLPVNESGTQFGTAVSVLEYNTAVELVFQGTALGGGVEHPMHLHGYSFYVVGSGSGDFDPNKDPPNYNLVDPPLMQTIAVQKTGWTAIRFKANNPGVWYMHCHFERHVTWGMEMVFIVKDGELPHEKMLPPPPDMPRCHGKYYSSQSQSQSVPPRVFSRLAKFITNNTNAVVDRVA